MDEEMKWKVLNGVHYETCDEKANVIDVWEDIAIYQGSCGEFMFKKNKETRCPEDYMNGSSSVLFTLEDREDLKKFRDNITTFLRETQHD